MLNESQPDKSEAAGYLWGEVRMAQLEAVLPALRQGRSVRRDEWEPFVRMFVSSDSLMCQSGKASPWHHSLTWGELIASDWRLIHCEAADEQGAGASVLTATHSTVPGAWLSPFHGVGSHYSRVFTGLVTKWWNAE